MQKIAVICAGDEELKPWLSHINNFTITKKAMLDFYEGTIFDMPIVILYSGVCKVNAAIATQILIDIYNVNIVINAGTAGGIDESINIFDTVISTKVAYHDVDDGILTEFHPWMSTIYFNADEKLLDIAKLISQKNETVKLGKMVTGEQFIKDDLRERIIQKYSPLSVDMETASIAHVCYVNQIPFISIRTITDTAVHSGTENFEKNCKQASCINKDVVLDFLKELSAVNNLKRNLTDVESESEAEKLVRLYPIILSGYNPEYVQVYLKEKAFLENVFKDIYLRISHIGSTSVPGLISKPIIDILLEIKKDTQLNSITDYLVSAGYNVNRPQSDIIMYIKGYGKNGYEGQVYHIHVRELADHNELYFRDYLIAHPEAAKEYGNLKQSLQLKYKHDRDGYTYAKGEFISKITKLARDEFKDRYKTNEI